MEHAINITHGRCQGALVGDVPHRAGQRQGINPAGIVVRPDQDRDVVAPLDQCFTEMAADEAGAAGYKYLKDGGLLLWFTSSGSLLFRAAGASWLCYHLNPGLDLGRSPAFKNILFQAYAIMATMTGPQAVSRMLPRA